MKGKISGVAVLALSVTVYITACSTQTSSQSVVRTSSPETVAHLLAEVSSDVQMADNFPVLTEEAEVRTQYQGEYSEGLKALRNGEYAEGANHLRKADKLIRSIPKWNQRIDSIVTAAAIERLKEAEVADLESALNYGSHQPDMARFYTGKANETHALFVRLQEGKSASAQEIAQALDVSGAEEISRPQFESSYD